MSHIDPDFDYVNSPTAVEPGRGNHNEILAVVRNQWDFLGMAESRSIESTIEGGRTSSLGVFLAGERGDGRKTFNFGNNGDMTG